MNDTELHEETLKSETIYKGKIFTLKKDTVQTAAGSSAERDVVVHPGGVGIVAMLPDGTIPMVRQYRKGLEDVSLEIPAGKKEYGEDPLECGRRELREETGISAKEISLLLKIAPTPAYCSEIIYICEAKDLTFTEQELDDDEFLRVEYHTLEELYKMIVSGEIIDAKTVAAVMYLYTQKLLG